MSKFWYSEFWRLALILALSALVGLLVAAPYPAVLLGLGGYLLWHLRNLYRLEQWLARGRSFHTPESVGIWGEVFDLLYRSQKTSRKRKKRLAAILTRFQQATAALPDATVVLGPHGEIEWFNEAARGLLGLRSPTDIGQRIKNLIRHPDFIGYIEKIREEGDSIQVPSPQNAQITLNLRLVPYGKEQQLLVARDVSQRIQLEQMRRDFIANVSHELRTPLTVINGYLETMNDSGDEGLQPWQRSLTSMEHQGKRMLSIVEDLLFLSRLENDRTPPPHVVVDVPALLVRIRDAAEQLASEKQLEVDLLCDRQVKIFGSEKELDSAFTNLVSNAVRYTPDGGEIAIRWYADGNGAHFEVSDTGPGIPPQYISRLTERFFRVNADRSRDSGGTGLGLAIVNHVLDRHHSALDVRSRLGRGSTFSCSFPPELIASGE